MHDEKAKHALSVAEPDARIIHRLDLATGPTGEGAGQGPYVGVAIDVETSGLDPKSDVIVELALRRFRYDNDGVITDIDKPYGWLEDPGRALSPTISGLTGLTDADLEGQVIDTDCVARLLRSASFVVAHNAKFDRPFIENRVQGARGLHWVCSMAQFDWRAAGFDGRSLGFLLMQNGFYHGGHRASADVDALLQLLRHRRQDGRTALSVMIENAVRDTWIIRALGAAFEVKDQLRARGYRWDADRKTWWREVEDEDRLGEEWWLAGNVYDMAANPRALGPEIERVTSRNRFL
jgi:DNA polymerase-3 subunit epsilon